VRRLIVFALLAWSTLSLATLVPAGQNVQGAASPARKSVRLRTLGPGDILYVLIGGGGNSLALLREEGVVLIDTKLPGWGSAIRDAIESATDRPVTTIINTHAHLDHVGGNVEFPDATRIIAHENTKIHMQQSETFKGANARFLPTETVTTTLSLLDGRDRMVLYYFGPAHTDGDLVVVFPEKRLAYFGDLFPSKSVPVVDTANGGSMIRFAEALARAAAEIAGVTRVVTGHEEGLTAKRDPRAESVDISTPQTMTWADVQDYAAFMQEFVAAARKASADGKSVDEAAATLSLPDRYKDYDMREARAAVAAVYAELKR
jgi:glyoxylase-like metal-dependent hydrolase (beta-lactamase superfamily II)